MAELTKLKKEAEAERRAFDKLQAERNVMIDKLDRHDDKMRKAEEQFNKSHNKYVAARTSGFSPKVVSEARTMGINPDNFEKESELKEAVKVGV